VSALRARYYYAQRPAIIDLPRGRRVCGAAPANLPREEGGRVENVRYGATRAFVPPTRPFLRLPHPLPRRLGLGRWMLVLTAPLDHVDRGTAAAMRVHEQHIDAIPLHGAHR
jgi:hypothetical protein